MCVATSTRLIVREISIAPGTVSQRTVPKAARNKALLPANQTDSSLLRTGNIVLPAKEIPQAKENALSYGKHAISD
jgi:hypothetical protein